MCAGKSDINDRIRLNTNRLHRLFEVGEWLAQETMKLLCVINLPKSSGYFTYCRIYNPKILHGAHIVLCVFTELVSYTLLIGLL